MRIKIQYLLVIATLVLGCESENKSIDVYSYQIENESEKSETLKKYLGKESGLIDAEYHIWFQDNGAGLLPGPSDYNITIAIQVESDSLNSWVEHVEPSPKKISIELWEHLKLDRKLWKLESEPELYHNSEATEVKLLFREENIVLGIYSTMPVNLTYLDE